MLIDRREKTIELGAAQFQLHFLGCLFWPKYKILIFSDLHFEKGSYLASFGSPIPLYDTYETLKSMAEAIEYFQPDKVICLGDNFHDQNSMARMNPSDMDFLYSICHSVSEWIWIIGNHDGSDTKIFSDFQFHTQYSIDDILFTHEAAPNVKFQIFGHWHPKISVKINGQTIAGKCFITTEDFIILPAFGSYTGGLLVSSKPMQKLLAKKSYQCYLIKQEQVWEIKR